MTTARAVRDDVVNFLDYLREQELAAYTSVVSFSPTRVSWESHRKNVPFLTNRGDPRFTDYTGWVDAGAYSAMLMDGALLQITYYVEGGKISGHRLAYVPCPYRLDPEMVKRDPILDIIDLHVETDPTAMVLHSTVRFDYDPVAARPGHPAAHMTINSMDCRIACSAPMHIGRFGDFVFRNFYPLAWEQHSEYFKRGAGRDLGPRVITAEDRLVPHVWW